MSRSQPTRSRNFEAVKKQCRDKTPETVINMIAKQTERAEDAAARIEEEGSVVRDTKGSVIAHPAIQIEIAATKLTSDLLMKHGKR